MAARSTHVRRPRTRRPGGGCGAHLQGARVLQPRVDRFDPRRGMRRSCEYSPLSIAGWRSSRFWIRCIPCLGVLAGIDWCSPSKADASGVLSSSDLDASAWVRTLKSSLRSVGQPVRPRAGVAANSALVDRIGSESSDPRHGPARLRCRCLRSSGKRLIAYRHSKRDTAACARR